MSTPASAVSGLRKAAILMAVLGEDAATLIYQQLPEGQVQELTREIAEMGRVPSEAVTAVLEEYQRLVMTGEYLEQGGPDYARRLLIKAFGEQGARQLLLHVDEAAEMSHAKLDSLRKADPQQLAKFLAGEHPQTVALTLAHLDTRQGSALLQCLPEAERADTVRRLALLRRFSPEMAEKVSMGLNKRLQSLGDQSRRTFAGLKGVADVLNRLEPAAAKDILEKIEQDDAKLALSIRNLMFTFEDLLKTPEQSIRELLGALEKKMLALALRGASEGVKAYIFKSMSIRAVDMLKEDMEAMGPVRGREITKAQMGIVETARRLEAEGKLVLKLEEDDRGG
jgi:flagellar motor switch protein FliG